jgi:hypothetical protein
MMGTYNLNDAVTREKIREGDKAIGIFLSKDISPNSNSANVGIFGDSSDRYQMASLPIHGVWNGISLTPDDPKSFSAYMAHETIGHSAKSVPELMESLIVDSRRTYEGKKGFLGKNPDITLEYSFMVIKPETLERMLGIPEIHKLYGNQRPEDGLKAVDQLLEKFWTVLDKFQALGSERDRDNLYYSCLKLSKSIFFQNHVDEIDGIKLPYAAKSMVEFETKLFDKQFYETFKECGVGEFEGFEYLRNMRALPDYYPEMYAGFHLAQQIFESMDYLDIPLQPAIRLSSGDMRRAAMIEMSTGTLLKSITECIEDGGDNMEMSEVTKVDRLLTPLKSGVADLIRQRNTLEKEIIDFDNEYN